MSQENARWSGEDELQGSLIARFAEGMMRLRDKGAAPRLVKCTAKEFKQLCEEMQRFFGWTREDIERADRAGEIALGGDFGEVDIRRHMPN